MTSDTYKGERVRQLPRRNRTYDPNRTCAEPGCTTRLSIYNRATLCWQHEPVRTFISRGKRKSREAA